MNPESKPHPAQREDKLPRRQESLRYRILHQKHFEEALEKLQESEEIQGWRTSDPHVSNTTISIKPQKREGLKPESILQTEIMEKISDYFIWKSAQNQNPD